MLLCQRTHRGAKVTPAVRYGKKHCRIRALGGGTFSASGTVFQGRYLYNLHPTYRRHSGQAGPHTSTGRELQEADTNNTQSWSVHPCNIHVHTCVVAVEEARGICKSISLTITLGYWRWQGIQTRASLGLAKHLTTLAGIFHVLTLPTRHWSHIRRSCV